MAQTAQNVIVGAANVAVGKYDSTGPLSVDNLWTMLKAQVSTGKDYRGYVTGLPTNAHLTYAPAPTKGVTWKDVGLTTEGIEVAYSPDFGEVEVDQLLDAAKIFKQRMTVNVNTTFAEGTLENLWYVWSQADWTLEPNFETAGQVSVTLTPGSLGEAPYERALLFVGQGASGTTTYRQRVYIASRALSVDASTHALRRNEATVFPVSFRLLPDTSASYSAYGRIVDVV